MLTARDINHVYEWLAVPVLFKWVDFICHFPASHLKHHKAMHWHVVNKVRLEVRHGYELLLHNTETVCALIMSNTYSKQA